MAKNRGSKEGLGNDTSLIMPAEQKASEPIKLKIAKIREIFPTIPKDTTARILHFYENDENQAIDSITKDGGKEALSSWVDSEKSKNKNNKNKKKKKKQKRDATGGINPAASFDADDSSSLHSGGNVDPDLDKDVSQFENGTMSDSVNDSSAGVDERLKSADEPSNHFKKEEEVAQENVPAENIEPPSPIKTKSHTEARGSPFSDSTDEHGGKKEKYRSITDGHSKYSPRQRTSSFRRAKSSSISEDSSSQHNPQAAATPTKKGFDKCKKDLYRQAISLQRIQTLVEKGLDESEKKIKNVFSELQKMIENRQKEAELELMKTKLEAMNLLKSRQDLAVDLRRRLDRTSQLSEAEWSELRLDVKQFVTERKYDDDLGKTIWFQWSDLSETIKSFGEVQPVKNVYSQRSHSIQSSSGINNAETNSTSLTNEGAISKDTNDAISKTPADERPVTAKEDIPHYKNPVTENRSRVYTNKTYNRSNNYTPYVGNQHPQYYPRGGRGRGGYRGNYDNYVKSYNNNRNYPHQGRNDGGFYQDRNMNPANKMDRGQRRGHHSHYRFNNYRGHGGPRGPRMESNESEPSPVEKSVVNGFVNNAN